MLSTVVELELSLNADRRWLTLPSCFLGNPRCADRRSAPTFTHRMKLLLIEDDLQAAEYLIKSLREIGYSVDHSRTGVTAWRRRPNVITTCSIADRQLPHVDGLTIITTLRERNDRTPVLILSALGTVDDRVHGLKAGGDDYLTKPFAVRRTARAHRALSRRGSALAESSRLKVSDLELDLLARKVRRAPARTSISPPRSSSCWSS